MSGGGGDHVNAVFYADAYYPIQAGSIDGTDIVPHDNAVYRAQLCSSAGLCTLSPPSRILLFFLPNFRFMINLFILRWSVWRSQSHQWFLPHFVRRTSFSRHWWRISRKGAPPPYDLFFLSILHFKCCLIRVFFAGDEHVWEDQKFALGPTYWWVSSCFFQTSKLLKQ